MTANRKQIIIKEIHYWKENRMLPTQYCDYLLALYTEGQVNEEIKSEKLVKKGNVRWLFLLLIPFALFILYFTELSFILQIALVLFLSVLGLVITYKLFKKGNTYQIPLIVSALILLLASVEVCDRLFAENIFALFLLLLFNCFLWIFAGRKLELLYFTISGWLGCVLLIISIFLSL